MRFMCIYMRAVAWPKLKVSSLPKFLIWPLCQFSWPYDNSSCLFSPHTIENELICVLLVSKCARCVLTIQNGRCHFVGNAHLYFMPIFMTSDNASFNFSSKNHENEWIWVLCLQIGTLRARDPKTEDFVLLGMLLLQICNLLLHDPVTILTATFPSKTMKMSGFAHFVHKCAHYARYKNRRCHFVGNAHLLLHANFHDPLTILTATFSPRPRKWVDLRASRTNARAARAQSQNRRCHFIGNTHLFLHSNFHDPPTILAATFPHKTMKMRGFAQFAH